MTTQDRVKKAEKLAAELSPIIASAISEGEITFVGLSVIVDDKYSTTFPFHAISKDEDGKDEGAAKAIMLAAVEYARTSGVLKASAIKSLEEFSS